MREEDKSVQYAREQQAKERQYLEHVQTKLKTDNAYTAFEAEIENSQEARATFEREIAGRRAPLAEIDIGVYLESQLVQEMFAFIAELACQENRVPTKSEWIKIIHFMAKILHIRQGHRLQQCCIVHNAIDAIGIGPPFLEGPQNI